jgi:hypothetical protein
MSEVEQLPSETVTGDDAARLQAQAIMRELHRLQDWANERYKGRRIRFVGSFNGQPWGRSRKSLAGKEAIITTVYLCERRGVTFHSSEPEFIHAGFDLNDVEFI